MGTTSTRYRDLLRNRPARVLLTGDLISRCGSWAFIAVWAFVLYQRTGSAFWITAGLALRWAVALVAGPVGGVVADRVDRGRVMVASTTADALVLGLLAALVARGAPLAALLVVAAVEAAVFAPFSPALAAALPDVVDEHGLATANGAREVINNVGVVLGPLLGGALLLTGQPWLGVAIDAVSSLVPAVLVLRLPLHSPGKTGAGLSLVGDIAAGIAAVRRNSSTVVLIAAMTLDSGVAGLSTALALPISLHVGTGSQHYTYLFVADAVGAVLVAAPAARLADRDRLAAVLIGSLLAQAVPFALIVVLPNPVAAFVLILVSGAAMVIVDVLAVTALQRDVPRDQLGTIFGLVDTLLLVAVVVTSLVAGALVSTIGIRDTLLIVGVGVPIGVLACGRGLVRVDRRTASRATQLAPIVALLRALDLFDGADQASLEQLAVTAEPIDVDSGTVVIREGEPAEALWLLIDGSLDVSSASSGPLPPVTAPGYVGELGLIHQRPRTASVTAAGACRLLRIPGEAFVETLSAGPASRSLQLVAGERLGRTDLAGTR